jgi:hypothetical protein
MTLAASLRARKGVSRVVAGLVCAYLVACAFCLAVPVGALRALLPFIWMLGPPANLVHGANYLVPFGIGTIVVATLIAGVFRTQSRAWRRVLFLILVVVWAFSGAVSYAPGA